MLDWEDQYCNLIREILDSNYRNTRAGATLATFGKSITVDLQYGFPILTKRQIFYKCVLGEFAALLRGPKHINDFKKFGCNYWDSWASEDGSLNLDYGNAWINYNGVNQLQEVIDKLKNNPTDRRILIDSWRPDRLNNLSLPCCHFLYQWFTRDNTHLDMIWFQRSVDVMIGLPSDMILAAIWNILLANECGYTPGKITLMLGDTHIYKNHVDNAYTYLSQDSCPLPKYNLNRFSTIYDFVPEDFELLNYNYSPKISFKLNV